MQPSTKSHELYRRQDDNKMGANIQQQSGRECKEGRQAKEERAACGGQAAIACAAHSGSRMAISPSRMLNRSVTAAARGRRHARSCGVAEVAIFSMRLN